MWCWRTQEKIKWPDKVTNEHIKNVLTRRKVSDTYLATVSRHRWSLQIATKVDKACSFSASTAGLISLRGRLTPVLVLEGAARG